MGYTLAQGCQILHLENHFLMDQVCLISAGAKLLKGDPPGGGSDTPALKHPGKCIAKLGVLKIYCP